MLLPCIKTYQKYCIPTQENNQAERYNKTLITRLRNEVAESQRDRYIFVQPLTYRNNLQVCCSTRTAPFSLVLSRHLPGQTTFDRPSASPRDARTSITPASLRSRLLHRFLVLQQKSNKKRIVVWRRYKDYHDPYNQSKTTTR